MDLTALQRGRLGLYLRILAISAVIGAVFGAVLALDGRSPLTNMVIGVANSVLIAGSIASIEIFLLREGTSMKRLVRLPFIVVILLKTLVYGGIVTAVVAGAARSVALMFPGRFDAAPLDPNTEP